MSNNREAKEEAGQFFTMVHPSELLRSDSNAVREFSAPENMASNTRVDCGLSQFPFISDWLRLEKFAKSRYFVAILSVVGFLQGVSVTYFRGTSAIWGRHYNIAPDDIDWIIYINEFFAGVLALVVAYWGNRIHRITWIGGLTMFHAVSSFMLLIPETHRQISGHPSLNQEYENLCSKTSGPEAGAVDTNHIALIVLGVYQTFFSMTTISFLCHGFSYLDDNASENSPAYIGIVLALRELGKQFGVYASEMTSVFFSEYNAFLSGAWLSVASLTFAAGFLLSLFPKTLPSIIINEMAASIADLAAGVRQAVAREFVDGFSKSCWRLFRNPVLLLNIFSTVLLQSALINFDIFEKFFNQSQFDMSTMRNDSNFIQLTTNLLRQPLVGISIVATGTMIAKMKPQLKTLIKWNIVIIILITLFFASTAFLKCDHDLNTEYDDILTRTHCSWHCKCSYRNFQPICINSKTLFSPCMAGCSNVIEKNSYKVYQNCTCDGTHWYTTGNYEATEGSCNLQKCSLYWTISQVNRVITSALIGSTFVTNLIINMKCVIYRDKSLSLGLEATFLGVIPYLPIRLLYGLIADQFCKYKEKDTCNLYSEAFGLFLSISTIILMSCAFLLLFMVLSLVRKRNYEDGEQNDSPVPLELTEMARQESDLLIANRHVTSPVTDNDDDDELDLRLEDSRVSTDDRTNSANSILMTTPDSLWEMENVGDDHDSIDESGPPSNVPKEHILYESSL